MDYRGHITVAVKKPWTPKIPEEEPDERNKACCCVFTVMADTQTNDISKNDFELVYWKKAQATDTVTFEIKKCGNNNALFNIGTVFNFPQDSLAVGRNFSWRSYLLAHGQGEYTIDVNYTEFGQNKTFRWGTYNLMEWTPQRAAGTVRLRSIFDSYSRTLDLDFTSSKATGTLRFTGDFGQRQPEPDTKNHIGIDRRVLKSVRLNENVYTLRGWHLLSCVTERLIDFFLLEEDQTFITDENKKYNHNEYNEKEVVYDAECTVNYPGKQASLEAKFSDRNKKTKSYYNKEIKK